MLIYSEIDTKVLKVPKIKVSKSLSLISSPMLKTKFSMIYSFILLLPSSDYFMQMPSALLTAINLIRVVIILRLCMFHF